MKRLIFLVFIVVLNCEQKTDTTAVNNDDIHIDGIRYATGFSIKNYEDFSVLNISTPFPNSDKTFQYALINREKAAFITLPSERYDGIVLTPIETVVVTSTTHLPALELLEVSESLIGFPGTNYISSDLFRKAVDNGNIREVGKNEDLNTELLIDLNPGLIVAFGIDGSSNSLNRLESSNIPVIYNGDWVESHPLAKAEWIKFFGLLYEKMDKADSIFNKIESDYIAVKKLASKAQSTPTALSGALHKDVWYLPSGSSTEAQFFKDANIDYLWSNTDGKGSLSLSFETVLDKAQNADIWFSPSYFSSLNELAEANMHYKQFKAYSEQKIYSFTNKTGDTGGVLYYETGLARPDLVLKDLIKIAHPELLKDYKPHFFEVLN